MPNFCLNHLYVSHDDPSKMEALKKAFEEHRMFDSIIPVPADLLREEAHIMGGGPSVAVYHAVQEENRAKYGFKNAFEFCCARWGTKWDVHPLEDPVSSDEFTYFVFETAWGPAIRIYETMLAMGFRVIGHYYEPATNLVGTWAHGADCQWDTSDPIVPRDLVERFHMEDLLVCDDNSDVEIELQNVKI